MFRGRFRCLMGEVGVLVEVMSIPCFLDHRSRFGASPKACEGHLVWSLDRWLSRYAQFYP
jgi:hypothetical protein